MTLRTTAVGEALPERVIGPINASDIVRFAGAGGDFNPLHHDAEFARTAGFPGAIAMGQLHAGMLASWISDTFGVENLRSIEVRFSAPVLVGDTLRCRALVVSTILVGGHGVAELELTMEGERGPVISGLATVAVA